jgi:hypothetical protein
VSAGDGPRLGPVQPVRAGVLVVAYHEAGPPDGDDGLRVIVPHLRGHGDARFLDPAPTSRMEQ